LERSHSRKAGSREEEDGRRRRSRGRREGEAVCFN
jgi:hypothetical protein